MTNPEDKPDINCFLKRVNHGRNTKLFFFILHEYFFEEDNKDITVKKLFLLDNNYSFTYYQSMIDIFVCCNLLSKYKGNGNKIIFAPINHEFWADVYKSLTKQNGN